MIYQCRFIGKICILPFVSWLRVSFLHRQQDVSEWEDNWGNLWQSESSVSPCPCPGSPGEMPPGLWLGITLFLCLWEGCSWLGMAVLSQLDVHVDWGLVWQQVKLGTSGISRLHCGFCSHNTLATLVYQGPQRSLVAQREHQWLMTN